MTHYLQKPGGPLDSTHHQVASARHACSPAPTASGVWSHDREPKGLSLCIALPYHQLLLKRQEKETFKISFWEKKKCLPALSWQFCFSFHSCLMSWGGRLLQSHIFKIGFNNSDTASQLSAKELEEHLLKIYTDRNKNEKKYKLGQRENQSRK